MDKNFWNKPLSTLLLIIVLPWLIMMSTMGLHQGLDFPKQVKKIEGYFIYDGSNNDPGWREHDWYGELVSVDNKSKRYAISNAVKNCFKSRSKSDMELAFKKPLKAELMVLENSDDQFSYSDGKADVVWGIRTEKVDTGSIDGLNEWFYSSWKYPLRIWVPLLALIFLIFLAWEELKQKKIFHVVLAILISATPPIVNAVWFYILR